MKNLIEFVNRYPRVAYEPELKAEFEKLGKAFCKQLIHDLRPDVKNHKYSYNRAGIACSGDHTIMCEFHSGDFFHMWFNLDVNFHGPQINYRRCYSLTDYTGDVNQSVLFSKISAISDVAEILRKFIDPQYRCAMGPKGRSFVGA